jgi:lysophospholipase L1-like esterase
MKTCGLTNVVCLGDSITHGNGFPERDRWPTALQGLLDSRWPGVFAVYNCGCGGDTTAQGIERMQACVLPLMPGIVIVEFGFNDACCREWQAKPRVGKAEFQDNLEAIAAMVRGRNGSVVYLLNHIPVGKVGRQGDGVSYCRRVAAYNSVVRGVARRVGAPVVDWPGYIRRKGLKPADYLRDAVHLSAAGNHKYASSVLDALGDSFAVAAAKERAV